MIKKIVFVIAIVFAMLASCKTNKAITKSNDEVLMLIEDEPIYSSEFLRVYNKNKDVVSKENKKDIAEYLDLFVNYKLKLREARDLKLDTVKSYLTEFNKYKQQLIEPYLKDRKVTDLLVKEAYDRQKKEIRASHILVMVKPNASPKDTLTAYNKIIAARNKILANGSFEKIAKKTSEDPSAKQNGGDLGYFSAFSMVYPFETAAFTTPVGEVSMPFRTKFGYHIVKTVDVRDSKGEVQVAHIMISDKKTDKGFAKKQINDIYSKFKQGESFENLAKTYSDDKASAVKGGIIRKFTQGKMIQPFADISFALENINDVSAPFETKYGWHIVKLLKRFPIKAFSEVKEELTKKVEKGERSILIGKSIATKLKKKYHYTFDKEVYKNTFAKQIKDKKPSKIDNTTILTVENKNYSVNDLKVYLKKGSKTYQDFIDAKVVDYYKDNLEFENKEFANTLQEYRDGLLLFDLLQNKIWTKAEKDTIGLQNFFDKNASKYVWKKRINADIASCTKEDKALTVAKYMREGKSIEEIKKQVNEGATIHVLFHSGTYEMDSNKLPKGYTNPEIGNYKVIKEDEKHFTIVNVHAILEPSQKELKDVKGKVISNYQDYLEKQWISNLKEKYTVTIKQNVLDKLIKNNK